MNIMKYIMNIMKYIIIHTNTMESSCSQHHLLRCCNGSFAASYCGVAARQRWAVREAGQ